MFHNVQMRDYFYIGCNVYLIPCLDAEREYIIGANSGHAFFSFGKMHSFTREEAYFLNGYVLDLCIQ